MISILRRFANSKVGAVILGLILIAFVVTLYEGKGGMGLPGTSGASVAAVGGKTITDNEASRRVQNQLDQARQQQPTIDMATFVTNGGVDQTVTRMIDELAMQVFGAKHGIVASKRLIDGEIASISAFNGPNGQFDRATFDGILQQRKLTEAMVRDDIARSAITKALLLPVAGGARTMPELAAPYATLLLEQRSGHVAFIPAAMFVPQGPPSDADLKTFYTRNIARYTVPERRTIRYALFDRTRFDGRVAPSEAEIAAAYKANAPKYAASEQRGFTQIIVASKADADGLYAKVRAGTSIDAAAKSLGLEALVVPSGDKAAFAKLTGAKVADSAFATPRGQIAPPVQSGLGYHIVRVDSITGIAAKTIDQARAELTAALTKAKTDQALSDFVGQIEDEVGDGATFDDVVKNVGLTAVSTPPVTANGAAPDVQGYALPDEIKPLLRDAFQAESGDEPQVGSVGNGQAYVFYHMDTVRPAAPRPLDTIKAQVATDAMADTATRAAKKVADAIAANASKGTAFADALAASGVKLPAPKAAGGRRIDISKAKDKVPAPVIALFAMSPKRAKVMPTGDGTGWFIAYLDTIVPGTAQEAAPLMAGTQQELSKLVGEEYAAQFVNAVRADVGVKRNDAAIAVLKRTLTGQK